MGPRSGSLFLDLEAPAAACESAVQEPAEISQPAPVAEIPFNESEEYRHACEVRYVAAMGPMHADDYCRQVSDKRGRAPAIKLLREARALRRQMEKTA